MTKVPIIHLFSVNLLQMVIMMIQCSCPYNFPRLPQFGFSFSWLEMPNRKTSIRCKKCSSVQWPFGERMHLLFPFDILTNRCKSLQGIPLNGLLYSRKFWMFEFRAVAFFDFEWHAIWWRRPLRWWNVASQAGSWRRSRIFKLLSHVFAQRVGRWDISTTHFYHHHHHHHLVIHDNHHNEEATWGLQDYVTHFKFFSAAFTAVKQWSTQVILQRSKANWKLSFNSPTITALPSFQILQFFNILQ